MQCSEDFLNRMRELLGDEYDSYLASFGQKPYSGLRVNTLKITPDEFLKISPFALRRVPWTENGFYYEQNCQPAKHPYYHAGLYYLQEPSAMTPAAVLPIYPGERVLDLCAAPGGKSTELAAKLRGEGVLISNDISASRAMALLKNLELFGVRNCVVLSEYPAKLERCFGGWFDKILVDAPCSGEGMFRREPSMAKAWEKQGPDFYHKLQKEIMGAAVGMLRPGGMMVYSTCTFSKEENEGTLSWVLENFPQMHVVPVSIFIPEGFVKGKPEWGSAQNARNTELANALRIFPHKVQGEGHFVALLRKEEDKSEYRYENRKEKKNQEKIYTISKETEFFLKQCGMDIQKIQGKLRVYGERVYLVPEGLPSLSGLRILKPGLYLGDQRKNRFEPAQPLANALEPEEFKERLLLKSSDPRVVKYLKGETIETEDSGSGWRLVCVDGFPLGFGKLNRGTLKNKYHVSCR